MASSSAVEQPSRPSRRGLRIALKIAAWLLLIVLVLAAGAAAYLYHAARRTLPQVDGSIAVAGLNAPVTVTRDAQGVPHIIAANQNDLFFAQGFVTAQDRMWQLDMSRRYAAGEMAELFGPEYLRTDKLQRILQIRWLAERGIESLAGRERAHFEAYARGVNAYLAQQGDRLPIEFRMLGYRPKPWTAVDSLLCGLSMTEFLADNQWVKKLAREHVLRALGPELTSDLYVNSSWRDHPPGQDQRGFDEPEPEQPPQGAHNHRRKFAPQHSADAMSPSGHLQAAAWLLENFTSSRADAPTPGSNNWVVAGARTASGKPLLSNDMHIVHTIPNVWYEAHLQIRSPGGAPTFDVVGFTIPGMPYVIVGHNQRIAWGITNLNPDVQDIYIEDCNRAGECRTPQGWRRNDVRHEIIHVKNAADVDLEVRITRHGPIVNDLVPGDSRTLALRWTAYQSTATVPFFEIDSAQNWQDFRAAFAKLPSPSSNIVYADVDGNIGYQATGQIPIRSSGGGDVPVSGADDTHEWAGYIPVERLPSAFNPLSGILATANNRIVPDGYAQLLANEWASPYRVERIYQLLTQLSSRGRKLKPEDMLRIQTDIHSEFDHFCAQRFVYAVDHATNTSPRAREAADIIRGWNGEVRTDSAAATLTVLSERQLWRLLLEPKLGPATPRSATGPRGFEANGWNTYFWYGSAVAMETILAHQPARWLPAQFKGYNDLLATAVDAAVKQAAGTGDLNSPSLQWGRRFPLVLQHPVFADVPIVRRWSGPGQVPQSGDGLTIKQVGRVFGPSERMTVDFSELDNSTFNLVTGQSGQLFSPHYMDQWHAWYEGFSFKMAFSDAAVQQARGHQLTLQPR
jgi:penicillin amidase